MERRNTGDLIGGLVLFGIGLGVFAMAFGYGIGTVSEMGAGFVPAALGVIIMVLSASITAQSFRIPAALVRPAWRPLMGVSAAIGVFALAIEHLGLVPSVVLAGAVAAAGDRDTRPVGALVLVVLLAIGAWLIFVKALSLSIPAFRAVF